MSLKKMILKKNKGTVDEIIIPLFFLFALFVVVIGTLNFVVPIVKYINANQVARTYILKIESNGYLTEENTDQLKTKLTNLGFTNIDLTGTTFSPVSNGDDVFLNIKYDQTYNAFSIVNFNVVVNHVTKSVTISRSSTAKN